MQSKAVSVEEYLAGLPEDRRAAIEAVRAVILKNLDGDIEERISYGMIGYAVPHRVFPAGYHCDPKMPLPYAGLASQKNYMSLYLCTIYDGTAGELPGFENKLLPWFLDAWKKTGKKLDMGKACIRFKKVEDLPLEVIGEAIRRVSAKDFVKYYEASREAHASAKAASKAGKQFAPGKMGSGKAQAFANPAKSAPSRVKAAKKHP